MKNLSIKVKLTLLYTFLMTLLICFMIGVLLSLGNDEILSSTKTLIQERVHDSMGEIEYTEDGLEVDSDFLEVEEGVFLALYDTDRKLLYGKTPPQLTNMPLFKNETLQTLVIEGTKWYIYDSKTVTETAQEVYVRGVLSVTKAEQSIYVLIRFSFILLPLFVLFSAVLGYFFIKKILNPIGVMTNAVLDIQKSENLAIRIPEGAGKDEFYNLAICFNNMLSKLDVAFKREKQFTSDVSHELRTPITVILSHCEYLLEQETLTAQQREEVEVIYKKAKNMAHMTSQLLFLTRIEQNQHPLHFEQVNISDLAEVAAEELAELAEEKEIAIVTDIDKDIIVTGDETLLIRLFSNLMQNAITYGKIKGTMNVVIKKDAGQVYGAVKDDGIGISLEHLPYIWERFYQADGSRTTTAGNTGLGLSMVKWIVEAHQGQITVESTNGVGSVFEFSFPISQV